MDLGIKAALEFVTLLHFVNLFFKEKKAQGFKLLLDFFCPIFYINPLYQFKRLNKSNKKTEGI